MIIILTDYDTGEKFGINFRYVMRLDRYRTGTIVHSTDGNDVVRESMDEIIEMLKEAK